MKTEPAYQLKSSIANAGAVTQKSRHHSAYLLIIVALGAFVRFFHISNKPLWEDEAWSWQFTQMSWPNLLQFLLHHEINMSPYHVLLKVWISGFGDSEVALRTLSAIAGLLTIPVVYAIGKRLFDSRVGLIASLLLALNAFHIRYSQETRGYALAVLIVCVGVLLFLKAVDQSSVKLWLWVGVLFALATYVHMFAVLVALALLLSLALVAGAKLRWAHVAVGVATFTILTLPLIWLVRSEGSGRLYWIQPMSWKSIAIFLKLFFGNSGFPLAAVSIICCVSAAVYGVRLWKRRCPEAWSYAVLLLWFIVPVALAICVSFWKPVFEPRYLLISLPAMVLLVATGLCSLHSRLWAGVFLTGLLIMSVRGVVDYYQKDFDAWRAAWPEATDFLFINLRPGDAIATHGSDSALQYYAKPVPGPVSISSGTRLIYAQEGLSKRASADALRPYARVWCLLRNKDYGLNEIEERQNQQLVSACEQGRTKVSVKDMRGLEIVLFERR